MEKLKGNIVYWNAEKAFGFIQVGKRKRYFAHITGFMRQANPPEVGQECEFFPDVDREGRPCAISIKRIDELVVARPIEKFQRHASAPVPKPRQSAVAVHENKHRDLGMIDRIYDLIAYMIVLGCIAMLLWDCLSGYVHRYMGYYYIVINISTAIGYVVDKISAVKGRWRVKESTLHGFEVLGGWPIALFLQRLLHHKSHKASYQFVFWVCVLLHCLLFSLVKIKKIDLTSIAVH